MKKLKYLLLRIQIGGCREESVKIIYILYKLPLLRSAPSSSNISDGELLCEVDRSRGGSTDQEDSRKEVQPAATSDVLLPP